MSFLSPTKNNPDPVPFYIKIEADSDEDEKKQSTQSNEIQLASPVSNGKCCDHQKKLEEFKLESSRTLQLALKSKTEEIRVLHCENKRLLENEKKLLSEINYLKNKLKNRDESSSSTDEKDSFKMYETKKRHSRKHKRNKKLKTISSRNSYQNNTSTDSASIKQEIITIESDQSESSMNISTNGNEFEARTSKSLFEKRPIKENKERVFKLSSAEQLDVDIWNSFKNIKSKLNRLEMTELQKSETNKVIDWIRELLINELDHKTSFGFIRKVCDGYYIERRCSKNNKCDGIWYSHINIHSRIVTVSITGDCTHYFSQEKKSRSRH